MEYERSESGILVPEKHPARIEKDGAAIKVLKSVELSSIINLLMVLIQLFTVWILWKTYQDTVVPTRQKELLSEQLAQLELDQKTKVKEIRDAKIERDRVLKEASTAQQQVALLTTQAERLGVESKRALQEANSSRNAASSAKTAEAVAKRSLESSQWASYSLTAGSIVSIPRARWIRKSGKLERAGLLAKDPLAEFHTRLAGIEKIWPDLPAEAKQIADILRQERSPGYPDWMPAQFASYFETTASQLSCAKPDFSKIFRDTEREYNAAAAPARKKALAEIEKEHSLKKLAAERYVKLVYPDDHEARTLDIAISNATYQIFPRRQKEIDAIVDKCYDEFQAVGHRFFSLKDIGQPTVPKPYVEELNKALSDQD